MSTTRKIISGAYVLVAYWFLFTNAATLTSYEWLLLLGINIIIGNLMWKDKE